MVIPKHVFFLFLPFNYYLLVCVSSTLYILIFSQLLTCISIRLWTLSLSLKIKKSNK